MVSYVLQKDDEFKTIFHDLFSYLIFMSKVIPDESHLEQKMIASFTSMQLEVNDLLSKVETDSNCLALSEVPPNDLLSVHHVRRMMKAYCCL